VSNGRPSSIKARIIEQIRAGLVRFTIHAHQEMAAENFVLDDVLEGLTGGQLLENYPEHKRGACALFGGVALDERPIHIVCTTGHPVLIVITVYEPKPPKWLTPTQRNL
jgi:hypothetical protein